MQTPGDAYIHRQTLPPAGQNPFLNGLKKFAKKQAFALTQTV
jgi:hypothetical protein